MNFENRLEHEDKQLIQLLKEEMKEIPSNQLVERTMTKISAMQAEGKFIYKPLILPLYIMMAIALLLLVPFLVPLVRSASLNSLSEFLTYPASTILKYVIWCWLGVVVLWIFGLLLGIQSKFKLKLSKA